MQRNYQDESDAKNIVFCFISPNKKGLQERAITVVIYVRLVGGCQRETHFEI